MYGGDNIIRNPRIEKLESIIEKNKKTIVFHQEKISLLEDTIHNLEKEINDLRNEDVLNLLSTKKLSFDQLEKLINKYADGIINDKDDEATDE